MQSVFKTVLQQRIGLAQQYSKGRRYQPRGTLQPYVRNDRRPHRLHRYAMAVSAATGARYKDSSLELSLQAWNRVPERLLKANAANIKQRLREDSYEDVLWEIHTATNAAILQL